MVVHGGLCEVGRPWPRGKVQLWVKEQCRATADELPTRALLRTSSSHWCLRGGCRSSGRRGGGGEVELARQLELLERLEGRLILHRQGHQLAHLIGIDRGIGIRV